MVVKPYAGQLFFDVSVRQP